MCQAHSDGGRRCPEYERLKSCTAADLAPEPRDDVPDVAWRENSLKSLWSTKDSKAANCAALTALEQAKDQEPQVTRTVLEAAEEAGAQCQDLEYRVKSPESLARKIRTEQEEAAGQHTKPEPAADVASRMKDTLRYTITHQDHDALAGTLGTTVRMLQAQGWEVTRIKNTYRHGAEYKGIHINARTPEGATTEVQVHSADSLRVKAANHVPYEVYRDPGQSAQKRMEAREQCVSNSARLKTPRDLDSLTRVEGVPVS